MDKYSAVYVTYNDMRPRLFYWNRDEIDEAFPDIHLAFDREAWVTLYLAYKYVDEHPTNSMIMDFGDSLLTYIQDEDRLNCIDITLEMIEIMRTEQGL